MCQCKTNSHNYSFQSTLYEWLYSTHWFSFRNVTSYIVKPYDKMYCSFIYSMQYAMHFINTPCVYAYKRYDDYQFPCGTTMLCSKRWCKAICNTQITSCTSDGYFSNACCACYGRSYLFNRLENSSLCNFDINWLCFFVTDLISTTTTRHNWWWCHQMKIFPRYWPFVRGIHRSPVNSPHKGQWHGTLMFSWICALMNGWVNNRETGDLRSHRAHYYVIIMTSLIRNINIFLRKSFCLNVKHRFGCMKTIHFDSNFSYFFCPYVSNGQQARIGSFGGLWEDNVIEQLTTNTWGNEDPAYWRMYRSAGHNKFDIFFWKKKKCSKTFGTDLF